MLPPKPTILPKHLAEIIESDDHLAFEDYFCEQIRRKRKRTPEDEKRLARYDEDSRRIQNVPDEIMREGYEAIDRGTSLLLKLIRSGKLTHTLFPTEKGKAEGLRPSRSDSAMEAFHVRLGFLNSELVRLAEKNAPRACRHLWFQAMELAGAVTRLALVHPEEFQEVAENSLLMPSLRAKNKKFTADAEAIAKAIHLSEKHPAPNVWDNKTRVGALCHILVVKVLEDIHFWRQHYEWEKESLERLKVFHETAERYRDVTLDEKLESGLHPHLFMHVMACAKLPDWKNDAGAWWKGRVLLLVKEEFERLAKNPNRNFALWSELKRGGERDTEKDMRRYMEKMCKNKFDQIVKDCP